MPHLFTSLPTEAPTSKTFSLDPFSVDTHATDSFTAANTSVVGFLRCTYKEDFKRILLPAVYSVVFLLGLPLNAAVILKIWATRPNLSKSNIYMLNLAIADFLYVMSLPLLIYNYGSHDYWPFGELTCKLVRFQFYSNLHGSILFLTCISVQRYMGICHPLAMWHKQGGRRFTWCICLGVWVVVAILCAPTFHFAATGTQRNRTVCYDLSTPKRSVDYYPYGMALTCLGFLVPFVGVMLCYCRMVHILCRPVLYQGVSTATGDKRGKAVRMIMVVAVVFCISFLPFHLTKTMYLVVRTVPGASCKTRNLFSIIYKSTRPFASMNSFLDPILFYFTQPHYRQSTRNFMLKVTTLRDKGTNV
ncbi:P2Y purinoceptor 3 [Gouania willdenowi]|uniref:G-protein coupled receptors family 1 profile domain-containing protein n=1 Tax=Gouania willdenowi TaxID=441366 RepID=A0A8C5FZ45_GOUWI|nr:P2Y purinoceptor 6 [Gouania willdenowi]XP_028320550.1 P2Y purinoceptor 6 [Gouania willdenowi]